MKNQTTNLTILTFLLFFPCLMEAQNWIGLTAPANLVLSCVQDQPDNQAAITDWLDNYTVLNNCAGGVAVTHDFSGFINYCTGDDITVTWTAVDDCGNMTSKSALIEITRDETVPILTAPANLVLSCVPDQQDNQAAITNWLDNYIVSDGCDSDVTVTHNFSVITINYCTGDDILVTWTATDDCGNASTATAIIVIEKDETVPNLTAPANLVLSCLQDQQENQAAITDWLNTYMVSDGCDNEVTVTNNFDFTTIDYCAGDDILVTWTATDDCGNSTTRTALIDLDKIISGIDGCPTDPNKIAPGICGCGIADTDSDNDGTADCNDGCPNDPNKIAPGVCGCDKVDNLPVADALTLLIADINALSNVNGGQKNTIIGNLQKAYDNHQPDGRPHWSEKFDEAVNKQNGLTSEQKNLLIERKNNILNALNTNQMYACRSSDSPSFPELRTGALDLALAPNPAADLVTIQIGGLQANGLLVITDITGRIVWSKVLQAEGNQTVETITLQSGQIPNGMYIVRIASGREQASRRLVVQN